MVVLERTGNVTDIGMRDLAAGGRPEPVAPSLPPLTTNPATKRGKIFTADLPRGADALGLAPTLRPLAELAVHRDTEAPLTIGLLGAPGSGKSFALSTLLAQIEALSAAAVGTEGRSGPFLSRIVAVRIDAAGIDGEPNVALAGAIYDKLVVAFPEFVHEVAHSVRDPHIVAREAAERLDDGRRRLDAERQSLDEIESRRVRLPETVLFEIRRLAGRCLCARQSGQNREPLREFRRHWRYDRELQIHGP